MSAKRKDIQYNNKCYCRILNQHQHRAHDTLKDIAKVLFFLKNKQKQSKKLQLNDKIAKIVHKMNRSFYNGQQTTDHIYGRKVKYLTGDRGYRGQQTSGDTKILIPDVPKASDSAYTKAKKHKLFRKRASIEPVIGHCKSDHRLGRNFYKGLFGDSINVILAAAAFNLKRVMRAFGALIQRWISWAFGWMEDIVGSSAYLTCACK